MGALLGQRPQVAPTPQVAPPPPDRSTAQSAALSEEQRRASFNQRGRSSTFLSGGGTGSKGAASVRFLGGAAGT